MNKLLVRPQNLIIWTFSVTWCFQRLPSKHEHCINPTHDETAGLATLSMRCYITLELFRVAWLQDC